MRRSSCDHSECDDSQVVCALKAMSYELRTNMPIEDSENNNVDENSNDHQYNQYALYHDQYTNHQFRRHLLDNDPQQQQTAEVDQDGSGQEQFYQRSEIDRLQNTSDEVDSRVTSRLPNYVHRRNLSEDLSLNLNNLPPLPRNGAREHLLNLNTLSRANWIPVPNMRCRRTSPSDEETRLEGEELLYNFAAEQFREENINPSPYLENHPSFSNPTWKEAGRVLRKLADDFARSQEREELKRKAEEVNMSSLTCENFFQLCSELFCRGGGITQERIVVLFTFISDIAIQQVKQRAERFISQLMQWSMRFMVEYICARVQEAGGWGVVLSRGANFVYRCTMFTLAAISIIALGVIIKKNWKEL